MKEPEKSTFAGAGLLRPPSLKAFGAALRRRREALGFTLDELMAKTRISKPYLSNIETGSAPGPASEEKLRRIAAALQIPVKDVVAAGDWLRTPASVRRMIEGAGRGLPRRADGAIDLDAAGIGSQLSVPSSQLKGPAIGNQQRKTENRDPPTENPSIPLRPVPLINRVAAGQAAEYTDLDYPAGVADRYVPMPDLPGAPVASAFALRVIGDSMMPEYREGEIVVVGPAGEETATTEIRGPVKDGEDCVVRLGEAENFATTFKRIFFTRNDAGETIGLQLTALNPAYAPRLVKLEDVSGIYPLMYRVVPARRESGDA
jgi:transcriptional regulator with XRE-family HTH domain